MVKVTGLLYAAVVRDETGFLLIEEKSLRYSPDSALETAVEYRRQFSPEFRRAYPIVGIAQVDLLGKMVKEVVNNEIV